QATRSEVSCATPPTSGGPAMKPRYPSELTAASAGPVGTPGSSAPARNSVGTTPARPSPSAANPTSADPTVPIASPVANPTAASAPDRRNNPTEPQRVHSRSVTSRPLPMATLNTAYVIAPIAAEPPRPSR